MGSKSVDELTRYIMSYKRYIGEFSMDLYYDDIGKEEERYVARLQFHGSKKHVEHFRKPSFNRALLAAFDYVMQMKKQINAL